MSKVLKNTVKNLKALSDLEIEFNGCTCIIIGGNNRGKSSFIRSLPDRFRGLKPKVVLKEGESDGFQRMELTTGEILEWKFNNKTASGELLIYTYKDENGKEIKTTATKEIMDRFFPSQFDIDEFLNTGPQKQRKMLQEVVGLDFTLIDSRYKLAYDERTIANNKLKDAKAQLVPINEKLETEEADIILIQKKLWAIDSHNENFTKAETGKKNLEKQKIDNEGIIKSLQAQIKKLEADNKDIDKRLLDADKWLSDTDNKKKDDDYHFQVSKELQEAQDKNNRIRKNNEAIKKHKDMLKLDLEAKEADKSVKAIENEKTEMIRKAKMPEGFEFDSDGILFNGLPVTKQQQSTSAIYIASLKLASMTIGEVRTMHFDCSFLDKFSLREVEIWAEENDFQLLIERCDFDGGEIRYELREEIK